MNEWIITLFLGWEDLILKAAWLIPQRAPLSICQQKADFLPFFSILIHYPNPILILVHPRVPVSFPPEHQTWERDQGKSTVPTLMKEVMLRKLWTAAMAVQRNPKSHQKMVLSIFHSSHLDGQLVAQRKLHLGSFSTPSARKYSATWR